MTENISAIVETSVTQRKKPHYHDELRKKHCQDYKDSGLSIATYCESNKISQSALRKWIKRFEPKAFFAPVKHAASINNITKQSVEVIFAHGVRLRFPELVDLDVIKHLIKEIASCN